MIENPLIMYFGGIKLCMKSFLHNFKFYEDKIIKQEDITSWLVRYHGEQHHSLFERYAVNKDYIQTRQVFSTGVLDDPNEKNPLYAVSEKVKPSLDIRAEHAQMKINEIFNKLYEAEKRPPSHLSHVSCSHYQSPSGAQLLVAQKGWAEQTSVTHLYHMGCYASMPAIRVSDAYLTKNATTVDIVHTELCSFHLDKDDVTPEQIIMKTLFADGAVKYSLSDKEYFDSIKEDGFELLGQKEIMVTDTEKEMTWKLGSYCFLMTLTRRVPILLARKIEAFMRELLKSSEISLEDPDEDIIFAIHPGGPKIIELFEKVLELKQNQVCHSKEILQTRGNMSSATLPYIWNSILRDKSVKKDTIVASVAFGPGLTMTGAVFRLCRN